jgi:hypothetical protein
MVTCKKCGRRITKTNEALLGGGCDACSTLLPYSKFDGIQYFAAERHPYVFVTGKDGHKVIWGTKKEFERELDRQIEKDMVRIRKQMTGQSSQKRSV